MRELWKQVSLGAVLAGLVLSAIVGASAQVYPQRWAGEPEAAAPAVAAGTVAIGDGGISLNPDRTKSQAGGFATNAAVLKFLDPSCTASNRGEIRLWVITGLPLDTSVDALCFCGKVIEEEGSLAEVTSYVWNCFH